MWETGRTSQIATEMRRYNLSVLGITSDHHQVLANLKRKLKKCWTSGQTAIQLINTAFLRDTERLNEFKIALNNRFQALQNLLKEDKSTMEDNWKDIKEALNSTCQEVQA
ncbi:unnamed protein product [Schistosoma margrebowiei]|uniref:Uncharacterized protein n=1 Tax=Schistosoma margrebowiei TaxID=48269 RepID=A0A183MU39_9TREM|nr:unnamed protein product [Schistosoma margrebowiei]